MAPALPVGARWAALDKLDTMSSVLWLNAWARGDGDRLRAEPELPEPAEAPEPPLDRREGHERVPWGSRATNGKPVT